MTVLIGLINAGDVLIAADRCASGIDIEPTSGELKTARLNDHVCVGVTGSMHFSNQVLSSLLGRPMWARRGEYIDVVRTAAADGVFRPGLSFSEAVAETGELYRFFCRGGYILGLPNIIDRDGSFRCSTLLAGLDNGSVRLVSFHESSGAEPQDMTGRFVVFSPGDGEYDEIVDTILREQADAPDQAVSEILTLYAKAFPNQVSRPYTVRRLSGRFRLEECAEESKP